jgi:hypothetical protein
MLIVYVKKITLPDSARTIFFSACRADLLAFNRALDASAAESKRRRRITEVTLDDIPGPVVKPPLRDIEIAGWPSAVLDALHVAEIRRAIPKIIRNHNWALLYRLSVDGCSYQPMYHRTQKKQQVVVVACDDDGDRFGAFIPSQLDPSEFSGFTGSGQTFVFKLNPQLQIFTWSKALDSNTFFVAARHRRRRAGNLLRIGFLDRKDTPVRNFCITPTRKEGAVQGRRDRDVGCHRCRPDIIRDCVTNNKHFNPGCFETECAWNRTGLGRE